MTEAKWDSYRNYVAEQIRHEVSLVFQRFNYFLLMTSFLIVAFVTLITSQGLTLPLDYSSRLSWIATTIAAAGFLLSYSFSVVNWMNARLIHEMGLFLEKVDSGFSMPSFTSYVSHLVPQHGFKFWYFFTIQYDLWKSFGGFARLGRGKTASARDVAPHTWMTPMFFALVWIAVYLLAFW